MEVRGEIIERGVVETGFTFEHDGDVVPGIRWRPEGSTGAAPVVLLGHGGTQHKRTPYVLGLARRFVRHLGITAVSLDAPGHGDRVTDPEAFAERRRELERRVNATGGEGSEAKTSRPFVDVGRAVREWSALVDLLEADGSILDGRIGYWGVSMGTVIGLPFVAAEPRVTCAVLGLMGLAGDQRERQAAAARACSIPVLFVFQWDDQLMTRQAGLDLFDAIGSQDKAMHVFPGGHLGTPLYEREAFDAFFARHLKVPLTA